MPLQKQKTDPPLTSVIRSVRIALSGLAARTTTIQKTLTTIDENLKDIEMESDVHKDEEIEHLKENIEQTKNEMDKQIEYFKQRYEQLKSSQIPAGNTLTVGDVESLRTTNISLMDQINDYRQREAKLYEQIEEEKEAKRDAEREKEDLKEQLYILREQIKKARKRKQKK